MLPDIRKIHTAKKLSLSLIASTKNKKNLQARRCAPRNDGISYACIAFAAAL
jgi:hypothetical protein